MQQHLQRYVYGENGSGSNTQHDGNQQQYRRNQQLYGGNQQLYGGNQQPEFFMWQAMQPPYDYGGSRSGFHNQHGRSQQHGGNRQQPGGNQQQQGGNQQQPGRNQQHHGGNQQQHCGMGGKQKEEFEFFFGPEFTFSQMHPAKFTVDGTEFCCMEQYMQYQKAVTFGDNRTAKLIMSTQDPKQHKKLGRKVAPFDPKTWGWKSVAVVRKGNIQKYLQNPSMKKLLFATYPKTLVEASPRDRLWGIGMGKDNPNARDRSKWRGKNLLGQTLTEVRDHLMTNYDKDCHNKKDKDVSKKSDEHTHSKKSDEHKHSKKSDEYKHSKKSDEHKHSRKSDEHKHSKKTDEHKHRRKSDEHFHNKKSEEHKHSKKSDEHKHSKKSDEHSSLDRFDTNESGRKDEQKSIGPKFRGETTHQKERSGDGKSSSSKKIKHEYSKDSIRSDGRHQSDEESSSSKKRKHEEDSRSERSHQPDEESSSSKKRKLDAPKQTADYVVEGATQVVKELAPTLPAEETKCDDLNTSQVSNETKP